MMTLCDKSRAHFYGAFDREVFSGLLGKVKQEYGPDVVAKLTLGWYLARRLHGVRGRAWLSSWTEQRDDLLECRVRLSSCLSWTRILRAGTRTRDRGMRDDAAQEVRLQKRLAVLWASNLATT